MARTVGWSSVSPKANTAMNTTSPTAAVDVPGTDAVAPRRSHAAVHVTAIRPSARVRRYRPMRERTATWSTTTA
ncbi:MAG TPA: hypothetical protein VI076_01975, partial [Actinopolymorphaceae bacterium]